MVHDSVEEAMRRRPARRVPGGAGRSAQTLRVAQRPLREAAVVARFGCRATGMALDASRGVMLERTDETASCLAEWSRRGPRYTSYPPATEFGPIAADRVRRELAQLGQSGERVSL